MAESLRKQINNSIKELVDEIGLEVNTGNASLRQTEFLLLKSILSDAGILPEFANESQESRITKCYKSFAVDKGADLSGIGSRSFLERQIYYLSRIAEIESIIPDYNHNASQLLRKLKLFIAVKDSLSGPCLTNAVDWHVLDQVQELSGGVWGIPNKLPIPANYVKVIGQPFGQFDGVAYGEFVPDNSLLPQNIKEYEFIFKKNGNSGGGAYHAIYTVFDSNIAGMQIFIRNTDNKVGIYTDTAYSFDYIIDDENHKYNIKINHQSNELSLYIDDLFYATITGVSLPSISSIEEAAIGKYINNHMKGDLCCFRAVNNADNSAFNLTFSESAGYIVYDTSGNGNDLTLVNATLGNPGTVGDFWQYDDTGELRPNHLIDGCFRRSDNGALVPLGVDTSSMTGEQLAPFSWSELPYTLLYPADSWADDMDKSNTLNWKDADLPAGREWSYAQIQGLPAFKLDPVDRKIFRKKDASQILICDPEQSGVCLEKTEKWAGEIVGGFLFVYQGTEQVFSNNLPVYTPI